MCDYSYAYIVVKYRINVAGITDANERNKELVLNHNAWLRSWISKNNNTLIDNAEYLDIVMSMYSLLNYGDNYHMTSRIIIEMKRMMLLMKIILQVIIGLTITR